MRSGITPGQAATRMPRDDTAAGGMGAGEARRGEPFYLREEEAMRCDEIMKRNVECVRSGDTVQLAARKMRDMEVGFLPVCDDGMRVRGAIPARDITLRVVADDRSAANTAVSSVMTHEVVACRPSDEV